MSMLEPTTFNFFPKRIQLASTCFQLILFSTHSYGIPFKFLDFNLISILTISKFSFIHNYRKKEKEILLI